MKWVTLVGLVIVTLGALFSAIRLPPPTVTVKPTQTHNTFYMMAQPPKVVTCTITAYTTSEDETDSTPNLTATMVEPTCGWTVAVSRDLITWLGGRVYIPGRGVRKVEDLMAPRWHLRIDILMPTKEMALEFGVKKKKVIFLGI